MITLLNDFPPYVAAYKATGTVDRDEYERIVMAKVDAVAAQFGAINFLVKLETGMQNYSVAALIDYLKISFKHINHWNRMAIVSDQKTVRLFYDALSPLVPGKVIGFELKDYEKAKAWVSEPFLSDENFFRSNKIKTGILAGIIGTSVMTMFSYVVSRVRKNNFKEPNLLGKLMQGRAPELKSPTAQVAGWGEHYSVGIAWALLFGAVKTRNHPTLVKVLFSGFSGVTGILMWKKMFDLNPHPPRVDFKKYAIHLFFAHLIYTYGMQKTYQLSSQPRTI